MERQIGLSTKQNTLNKSSEFGIFLRDFGIRDIVNSGYWNYGIPKRDFGNRDFTFWILEFGAF